MKLAVNGGMPIRTGVKYGFPQIDRLDICNVMDCFKRNSFSSFRAGYYDGGVNVVDFENAVCSSVGTKYAVSFDTWSNGMLSCLLSLGIGPGDEVLITPYTMTSCASAILGCGALPVFVDIDKSNFGIDTVDLESKITCRSRAVFVVHLFGVPSDMDRVMSVASKYGLFVFEDCAQAPLAVYKNQFCGTFGDVGGFSLTESKHVMSGEGGIAITNNDKINNGLRIVRNHGEVCITSERKDEYAENVYAKYGLFGYNFRMTELVAALAKTQWNKLAHNLTERRKFVNYLNGALKNEKISFLKICDPYYDCVPSWYVWPLLFDESAAGFLRKMFVDAINAEGFNFNSGYVHPLYCQSIYSGVKKHWVVDKFGSHINYTKTYCKNVEDLYNKELVFTLDIRPPYDMQYMEDMIKAIRKVANNSSELK